MYAILLGGRNENKKLIFFNLYCFYTLAGVVAGLTLIPVVMLTPLCIGLVVCVILARKRHYCKDKRNAQGWRERSVHE